MKKILKITLWVLLVGIVLATFGFLYYKSKPKKVVYNVEYPERRNIETKAVATGSISPRDEILIKPQIAGIVSEIHKKAGDLVKAGEIIATVKVVPDVSSLNMAESQLKTATINLEQIKSAYERDTKLYQNKILSKEDMEKTTADYKKAVENLENAKDNLDIIKSGVSQKTKQYSNTQIRSTIDGMILSIPIKAGNSVIQTNNFNEGTTIATIADMNDMIFIGNIDETEVGRVKERMPIILTIGALESTKFNADLEYISPKGVESSGAILFEIKAAAKIPDSIFVRAGYSANADIVLGRVDSVVSISEAAISFRNDSSFVHTLKEEFPEQIFEEIHVVTGLSDGINIEIKSGLSIETAVRGREKTDKKSKK